MTESSERGTSIGTESSERGTSIGSTSGDVTTRVPDATTAEYLDGLRAALADLPAAELAEITEDARGHLADLAAELGTGYDRAAVHARLGAPREYAAELRAAAGFPAAPVSSQRLSHASAWFALLALAPAILVAGVSGLNADGAGAAGVILALLISGVGVLAVLRDGPRLPSVASLAPVVALLRRLPDRTSSGGVTAFVVSLQPGWWVLRGVTAAALVALVVGGRGDVVPAVLLVTLVAVPVSVLLGARTRADLRLLWVVLPLNAFAVGALAALAFGLAAADDSRSSNSSYTPGLARDGVSVDDVRPFDSAGRPLSGVYLFDEDGRPLSVQTYDCDDRTGGVQGPEDTAGPYPRGTTYYDPRSRECVRVPPRPMVVTIPGAAQPARPTPASGAPTPGARVPVSPASPVAPTTAPR